MMISIQHPNSITIGRGTFYRTNYLSKRIYPKLTFYKTFITKDKILNF